MSASSPSEQRLDRARLIEEICDRFERACRTGAVRPEDFLDGAPVEAREELLAELRALHDYHRGQAAQTHALRDTPSLSSATIVGGGGAKARGERVAHAPPLVPGYEILGEIGRGGMGVVYRARHLALNRIVALKMILAGGHAGEQEQARFRAEAEAAARLQHPGIVQVYEVGQASGLPFLALEWVEGGSLDERLAGATLPPRDAARLVEQLARALAHAHERGVVHRDLKPANVLLASGGREPPEENRAHLPRPASGGSRPPLAPKLTDFGLAKRLAHAGDSPAAATQTGAVVGTPSYMAPEQASGKSKDVGPLADVYSLGAILYECLTGRPPFKAETVLETLVQVQTVEVVGPRRLQPSVPRDLETICLKCLRKEPHRRYDSALSLADDLARFLAGQAIAARPVGGAERAVKWVRRRPAIASLLLLLVATVATAFALVTWKWLDADYHRGQAERARESATAMAAAEAATAQREKKAREDTELALAAAKLSGYYQSIAQADLELQANNPDRAARLLDGCPPELRHWEWHYLKGRSSEAMLTLKGHTDVLRSVAYSPDGKLLASVGEERTVRLWEMPSGRPLQTWVGHTVNINTVAFSPEGRRLVTAAGSWQSTEPGEVKVWDIATGKRLVELTGAGMAYQAVFSPDGRSIAVGWGSTLSIRNAATGRVRDKARDTMAFKHGVQGVAYSPSGDRIAIAVRDNTIRLLSAQPLKEIQVLGKMKDPRRLAFSHDGKQLAARDWTGQVTVWDLGTRKQHTWRVHPRGGGGMAFSSDNRYLITGGSDGQLKVWRAADLYLAHTLAAHEAGVGNLALSPGGQAVATAGYDHTVKVWDLSPNRIAPPVRYLIQGTRAVAFSPDGQLFAVAGRRRSNTTAATSRGLVVYETATRRQVWGAEQTGTMYRSVAFSPDSRWLASDWGKHVKIRNARTGALVHTLVGHQGLVTGVAFSVDGCLASASEDGAVFLWALSEGEKTIRSPRFRCIGHTGPVRAVAYAPKGDVLASAGDGGTIHLWRATDGKALHRLFGHQGGVTMLAFARDGGRLVSAGKDGTLRLWDARARKPLFVLTGHKGPVTGVTFTPDGRRLASIGVDRSIVVWDAATGQEVLAMRRVVPVSGGVTAFSPDGHWLLTTGGESGIGYWLLDGSPDRSDGPAAMRAAWLAREAKACEEQHRWPAAVAAYEALLAAEPKNGLYAHRRAWARIHLGDWEGAARDIATPFDVTDFTRLLWQPARLHWFFADAAGYQRLCRAMIERHASGRDGYCLFEAARFCCLSPGSGVDPRLCVRMAEQALEQLPRSALRCDNVGLARYRAGDWKGALAAFERAKDLSGGPILERHFIQAMAHHQLGEAGEAKKAFARGMVHLATIDASWRQHWPALFEEKIRFQNEAAALLKMPAVKPLNPRWRR